MKIKAKKGYNIVLNDLKIALSSNGKIVEVDKEQFNTSIDAKQLSKFIEIVNENNQIADNTVSAINNLTANKVADQAFVIGSNQQTIENAVLMDPDNVVQQSVKKVTKLNDTTTVIQAEKNNKVEETNSIKVIDTKQTNTEISKAEPSKNGTATMNSEKIDSIDNNSKQLTKKAKADKKENKNNKVEEINKKDQNKNE